MRLASAIVAVSFLVAFGSGTGTASATLQPHATSRACFSIDSLGRSLSNTGNRLAITHRIAGSQAQVWATEVARRTGSPLQADEVATVEGSGLAPLVMLIFAANGCALDIVLVRIVPDAEI